MDMEGLSVICAGLGLIDEDENGNRIGYAKGEYCLDNLKDLLRFLRRDDPQTREVFKQVCKWNIVGKDLVPIIEYCQNDRTMVLNAVKVLVFLTMPVEHTSTDIPQQIEYLWGLKSSITCSDTVPVIVSLLDSPLENLECEAFTEDDWKLVQLVLTLFRNLLAIQDITVLQKVGLSATQLLFLRDRFLELLFRENVMDLIIVLTQHVGGSCGYLRQDNLLLLETFHYIFIGQEPELISKAYSKCSKVGGDAKASLNSLKCIMEEEKEKKRLTRLHKLSCYSQFSGTFTRLTMDGSKTLLKGIPCSASRDTLLKPQKNPRGPLKRTVWEQGRLPPAKDNILELLHDFLNQFLSGGYNVLVQSVREDIEKEHHAIQNSDVAIFFRVAQFVTSFQYHKLLISKCSIEADTVDASQSPHGDSTLFKGNICGPIAASMNEPMFLLVLLKWRNAFDGLKEIKNHQFLSTAGSLMKIMIRMLDLVLKLSPEDSKEPQTARILLYKLFYDQTDQGMTQFLLNLIKSFDTHKQAKSDLADLVEITHVIIRLMENLQARGTLRVSKKSRKKKKKKALNEKKDDVEEPVVDDVAVPNEIGISGCEPSGDQSTSQKEKSIDASSGAKREDIHCHLIDPETSDKNMAILKDKVTVLENKKFGHVTIPDEIGISGCEPSGDLSMSGKENVTTSNSDGEGEDIHDHLNEPETSVKNMEILGNKLPDVEKEKLGHDDDDPYYGTDKSSGDEQVAITDEVDFNVSSLVSALANNNIIHHLCWLLKFYKSNSTSTNHYIISMLRRICDELELSPMLYQLSLLITFHSILAEQQSCPCKEYENIVVFLKSLVRRMMRKMKSQPLLFVEVLFLKTRKECHYINCDSIMHELGDLKKQTEKWGNDSKDDEVGSSQGKGWVHRSIGDALGDDEADVVLSHEIDKQDEGNSAEHEFERAPKRRKSLVLNDELEGKITDLYEKYKDNQHCSRLIAEALDPDGKVSPAQVSNKLRQLGLKVRPKKRMLQAGRSIQLLEKEKVLGTDIAVPHLNVLEETSLLRQPLHTRKRVRAFSEDQETMIKALFEQFKDHKRCSYMIANALDADIKFTAAQISRKLKQLGLRVPQQKSSETNMHLRDEFLGDPLREEANNSDNETLASLRKSKSKQNGRNSEGVPSWKIDERLSQDDSEEELLSSVLKKTRRRIPKAMDLKVGTNSVKQTMVENDYNDEDTRDLIERDGQEQHAGKEAAETDGVTFDLAGNAEAVAPGISGKPLGVASDEHVDHLQHQLLHDNLANELTDLEDDGAPVTSQKSAVVRRKLRMIIDLEDDE